MSIPVTIDQVHTAHDILNEISYSLEDLAAAFAITGNTVISDKLAAHADTIRKYSSVAPKYISEDLGRQVAHMGIMSGNMINLAMKMGEKENAG